LRIAIILATSLLTGALGELGVGCCDSCGVVMEGDDNGVVWREREKIGETIFSDWEGIVVVAGGSCFSETAAATGAAEGRNGEVGVPNACNIGCAS
jgi:hypothetical protein